MTISDENGDEFLVIDLIDINQKGQRFYFGKVIASDLLDIFTVRPAIYDVKKNTSLAESFPSEREYYEFLIEENKDTIDEKDFQRRFDQSRVSSIKNFVEENEYPFFPNTIIANCDLINEYDEFDFGINSTLDDYLSIENRPRHLSYFFSQNDQSKLVIPKVKDSLLIIDGQHRLEGLKKVKSEVLEEFELMVSFLIGLDRSTIAQQFYTINYEQKPVNKSLLYHLTGEFSTELNELTFLHHVVRILNELETSPLHKRVKMLGINPPNVDDEEKKALSVSQAFLIDQLKRTISEKSKNSIYQPIFLYHYLNEEKQIEIIRFLKRYFNAISSIVEGWENPGNSIVSKGMGIGALIRVLHLIIPILFVDEWDRNIELLDSFEIKDLTRVLSGLENVDFTKEGKFGGVGSGGSLNKIKEEIIIELNYLPFRSYNDFEINFRDEYLPIFRNWTNKVIDNQNKK